MCESCSSGRLDRRDFLAAGGALGAAGLLSTLATRDANAATAPVLPRRAKEPARVRVAFLYPPADVVNEGRMEDSWRQHHWFTWPGNQFQPEQQERTFTQKIREIADTMGIRLEFAPQAICQEAKVAEFIADTKASPPDAVLIVNFWNTFSKWAYRMATESAPTAIVYHSVGSNHQLPPEYLRTAEGLYYIHSIENWAEIERALRAVHAKKMLVQSRLLRVSGHVKAMTQDREKRLECDVVGVPAEEFNGLFDAIKPDDALVREAMDVKRQAVQVMDVTDEYFVEAMRAHRAVAQIIERYGADAITIECLFLKHRKPCLSFARNNGDLIPCGCENDLNASLSLMLGASLFGRGGFQHNPEFDTEHNLYFASHCTCTTRLHGPKGRDATHDLRPFFHQIPKTMALDVQWPAGEPVTLFKYQSGKFALDAWHGQVVSSPTSPPTGGCATRVLVKLDGVADVCTVYAGPHPILYCGDFARHAKVLAQLYGLEIRTNG